MSFIFTMQVFWGVVGVTVVVVVTVVVFVESVVFPHVAPWLALPTVPPDEGTNDATIVSPPLASAFREGRLGGRRAIGTLPKLCMPSLRGSADFAAC